ncbi:MAG TPA: FadD3 family acyl-CoA ligase [Acidimicrobiales bacterium]|nr:FadD3 family acyl-CoA ligase [Acidimicrobiales bacterium]
MRGDARGIPSQAIEGMHYPDAVSDVASDITDPRGDLQWGTIPGLVEDAAARFGESEALVDMHGPDGTTTRLTFDQLADEVAAATRAVVANGIERGDRVAIWAPNCAEWVIAALGAVGAGALLVPLNTRFKGTEAAYILRESGARVLFTVDGFLGTDYPRMLDEAVAAGEKVPELERVVILRSGGASSRGLTAKGDPVVAWDVFLQEGASVSADVAAGRTASITSGDLSDLVFTSGTTGRPKGAMTTHGQSLRTFATWSEVVGLRQGDRYLIVNPFFHTFGYKAGILACLMAGVTMVPEPVFDVDQVLRRIEQERISVLPGPPTIFQSILDHPDRKSFDLASLRLVVTGAAPVPVELVRGLWSDLGIETVLTAYGLTEATGTVTMCRRGDPAEVISGTSGRAIPDVDVRIVDPGGAELARGEAGEIIVRGYNVMRGYFNDAEATDEAVDAGGWLHTGDVGVMDGTGNVTITDRLKDMYVSGGFNVYPAEIEAVLRLHPDVGQVAVIGVPDRRMGEVGLALVVPAPGGEPDGMATTLTEWALERLANYKVPRRVEVVGGLPVNASGKVLKRELREQYSSPE